MYNYRYAIDDLVKKYGSLLAVCEAVDCSYTAIKHLRTGQTKHPRIDTHNKIEALYRREFKRGLPKD